MRTEDLIVELAAAAGPIRPLPTPSVRLARWAAAAVSVTALGAVIIGLRADVATAIHQSAFAALAVATLSTALISAAAAFVLSVPGAERSVLQRAVPLMAGGAWVSMLVVFLAMGPEPMARVLALPFHWGCLIQIAALSVPPGWALFAMLRRAAPLERTWSAALAALAAVALGAAATQFICPVDDPAHQLVGHVLPVASLSVAGAVFGRRSLDWLRRG